MDLKELFEHGAKFAKETFEKQGSLTPMWIGQTTDGQVLPVIVVDQLKSDEHKDAIIDRVKRLFAEKNVTSYVAMVEAWSYAAPKKIGEAKAREEAYAYGNIADHPHKVEIIHIVAEDRKITMSGQFEIKRDDKGNPTLMPFKDYGELTEATGRFTGLLRPTTVH